MLRAQVLKPIYIPSEHIEADRDLLRQRNRSVKDLTRVKNRVKSILMTKGIDIPEVYAKGSQVWSKRFLTWLKQVDMGIDEFKSVLLNFIEHGEFLRVQVLKLNRQVRALSKADRYSPNPQLVFSIPGIGLITGMTLLTELGPIERFAHLDQLCSYVGLIPTMHNSGNKVSVGEMTHRGRKVLKVMVIEASWMAVRYDPALHQRYEALRKQGMTANKAIIRIAKKLLNRFRHVVLTQTPYQIGVVQ